MKALTNAEYPERNRTCGTLTSKMEKTAPVGPRCKLKFMNRLTTKFLTAALATASLLSVGALSLQAQGGAAATATKAATAKVKAPPTPAPTDADIADAKAKGLVWVNLNTKVYHASTAATYGKTKRGQFMSEADAQKAGYKAAQEPKAKKSATAAPAAK